MYERLSRLLRSVLCGGIARDRGLGRAHEREMKVAGSDTGGIASETDEDEQLSWGCIQLERRNRVHHGRP